MMAEKIYNLGIDIGNKLVKIFGDKSDQPLIYPASLVRYEDVSYMFNNNIDYLEENGFETFSLEKDSEQNCYIWGKKVYKFGQSVVDTNGTGEQRYDNQLYKNLVLFAIAKYAERLYQKEVKNKVRLSIGMGMPDNEYLSLASNNFISMNWLIGDHIVFVDNLPIEFEIKQIELMPQEFGSLVLFEKTYGGIAPDVRTMIIDYGGMTRLRTVYDGFQQREINQEIVGIDQLIRQLVDQIKSEGVKNNRRNNQIIIQEMLMSKNYKMKIGVSNEIDFTKLFQVEIEKYVKKRFEEDVYSGQVFNNVDLVILTGGGANLLDRSVYSQLGDEIWVPEEPETANVRGFYEYLSMPKFHKESDESEVLLLSEGENFILGDNVRISETANVEANGYDLTVHRNWEGTIIEINQDENGKKLYTIEYPSGEKNLYVYGTDLIKL